MTYRSVIAASAACFLLAAPAAGQSPGELGRSLLGCSTEIASLCQNTEPGRSQQLACLVENRTKLSGECASAVDVRVAERAARKIRMAACRADLASLCRDAERGGGRKMACLRDNQAKLSAGCASALIVN